MKRVFNAFLALALITGAYAGGVDNLRGINPQMREFLSGLQSAANGSAAWLSMPQANLSTSVVNSSTSTYQLIYQVKMVDENYNPLKFFNKSVSGFSIATAGTAHTGKASLGSSTLVFVEGSAPVTVNLTGTWKIGSTATLTVPALSVFGTTAVSRTKVLSFTE